MGREQLASDRGALQSAPRALKRNPLLDLLRSAFWGLFRLILSLRYRVRIHGLERARRLKGPVLILPNHPGYIDPPLVVSALWGTLRPQPVIYEGLLFDPDYLRTPFSRPLARLLGAVLVPDLDRPNAENRARAEQVMARVSAGLARGQNFILWPAGQIQRDGVERLRAARASSACTAWKNCLSRRWPRHYAVPQRRHGRLTAALSSSSRSRCGTSFDSRYGTTSPARRFSHVFMKLLRTLRLHEESIKSG